MSTRTLPQPPTSTLKPHTRKLLTKIKEAILKSPKLIDMYNWYELRSPKNIEESKQEDFPACGMAACIGGWAILMTDPAEYARLKKYADKWGYTDGGSEKESAEALKIDDEQAERLFYVGNWPRPMNTRYFTAKTPQDRAQATADRIDRFIESGGKK